MSLHDDLFTALTDFHASLGAILERETTPLVPIRDHVWQRGDILANANVIPYIPAGTVLKDKDDDLWYKHDSGVLNMSEDEPDYSTAFDLADFLPATVVCSRPVPATSASIPARSYAIGETVSVSDVTSLPVGSVVTDRDNDFWQVQPDGAHFRSRYVAPNLYDDTADEGFDTWAPFVLQSLPAEPLADWERELLEGTLEQAQPAPEPKAAVGDLVRVTANVSGGTAPVAHEGKVYQVETVPPSWSDVTSPTGIFYYVEPYWIVADVEKVTQDPEPENTEPATYGVGDVVPLAELSNLPVGTILSDRDGDRWHVGHSGLLFQGRMDAEVETTATDRQANWTPYTVVSTPVEEAAAPEPESHDALLKADYNQAEIRVEHSIHNDGGVYFAMTSSDDRDEVYTWLTPEEGKRILTALQALLKS